VVVKNMFDAAQETEEDWDLDIKMEIEEECSKLGSEPVHVFVDKNSQGLVYLRFKTVADGQAVIKDLHGRWFAQRQITAECVSEATYTAKFPESAK